METSEFDLFADEYYNQHKENISASGEAPEYFSQYKIADMAMELEKAGIKAENILDFGSGIGNSVPFFRKYFPDGKLYGADVSQRSLEIAQQRFPGSAEYVHIKDNRLPFEDGQFDAVFSACVFHHIPHEEHDLWLRELNRVTRSGGRLVIFEHNPFNPLTLQAVNTCPFDVNAKLVSSHAFSGRVVKAGWENAKVRFRIFFPARLARFRKMEKYLTWLGLGAQYYVIADKK